MPGNGRGGLGPVLPSGERSRRGDSGDAGTVVGLPRGSRRCTSLRPGGAAGAWSCCCRMGGTRSCGTRLALGAAPRSPPSLAGVVPSSGVPSLQDGKRAIDLALEQGHGLCVQLLQDRSLPDPHGARRSLSFLSEDRTDAELLSSTRVSQLDELGLGGSCGLGEPPCCAQPSLGPSPTPRLPGGPALPLQPLASSTLLWAGGECEEVPLKGTGVRCSLQPGAGARSPPQPLRCSGDRGVLEAGTGGHDLPGDSSEDSERFVTAVEMLEPNGAGVCPGEAPSSEELPVLFQGCSLECSPPAPRGSLASRLALLQGMALCRGCSPPSSATSPPAPRAASRPQQQGSALPPPPPPPSSMPAWKSPAGPPGSEHPGVSPGILAPPQDTALPSVVRMCPEGMEKAQCLQMTPRSSPGPPASPAPPWEPAAPAPQCCWLMGITAVPRTLCRVLRDPSALQCCWALGVTATPRTPHQMLGVLPAPRCCRVQGTVTTPRIPHHTFRAPLLPLTPGCRSQGPPRCHAHPLTTAPTAPWNPMDARPLSGAVPVLRPPALGMGTERSPCGCSLMKRSSGGCGRWATTPDPSRCSPGACTCGGWRS